MTKVSIVTGANYGDEGKGLATDMLARSSPYYYTAVVRANGGAQAGHTVVTTGGIKHVFHHIGAGTFAGAETVLGPDFVLNPIVFNDEYASLLGKIKTVPDVFANLESIVSTPLDAYVNTVRERMRSNPHGSTGLGVNESILRHRQVPLKLIDLYRPSLEASAGAAFEYSAKLVKEIDPSAVLDQTTLNSILTNFIADCQKFASTVKPYSQFSTIAQKYDQLIFEGAQGLMLDQRIGEMPYCTPSDTTPITPLKLIENLSVSRVEIVFVTRAYLTRHGAGPLLNECSPPQVGITTTTGETNVRNPHQGNFRYAPLNVSELKSRITRALDLYDESISQNRVFNYSFPIDYSVLVTCCDQMEHAALTRVLEEIDRTFSVPVTASFSACGTSLQLLQNVLQRV